MERRSGKDRRRPGPTPRFPFRDSHGQWVTSDRRRLADRRLNGLSNELFWQQMESTPEASYGANRGRPARRPRTPSSPQSWQEGPPPEFPLTPVNPLS